jgi:hypothetical protein
VGQTFNSLYEHFFVRFRRERMKRFFGLIAPSSEVRLLDIGGTAPTWTSESETHTPFSVTLINKRRYEDVKDGRF